MHRFADEEQQSALVQDELAEHFRLAESLYNVWLDIDRNTWTKEIPHSSANLALILDVQACRLYRSVTESCQRSEAFCASILTRTLFETILGVAFLLKKDVRIVVEPVVPKGTPAGTPPAKWAAKFSSKSAKKRTRKYQLSRELRANLYQAHAYFTIEGKSLDSLGKFPGYYHKARKLKKDYDPQVAAEYEKEIGVEWTSILRNSDYYSGLSVELLAKVIHISLWRWYKTVYHYHSRSVHATDILRHIDIKDGEATLVPRYLSSTGEVHQSLRAATGLFLAHADLVHENIGLGPSADTALHHMKQQFNNLSGDGAT